MDEKTYQLLINEKAFRLFLDVLDEGLLVQDENGTIEYINSSGEKMIGMTSEEIRGMNTTDKVWNVIHLDGTPFATEQLPSRVAFTTNQKVLGVVAGIHRPDGGRIWTIINSAPILDEQNKVRHALSTFTDITELIEKNQEVTHLLKMMAEREIDMTKLKDKLNANNNE